MSDVNCRNAKRTNYATSYDHNYVCYKEGHEHWCVGGQRAIAAGLTEFCGCQHIYAGCQAFPADPAATPPPTDED